MILYASVSPTPQTTRPAPARFCGKCLVYLGAGQLNSVMPLFYLSVVYIHSIFQRGGADSLLIGTSVA